LQVLLPVVELIQQFTVIQELSRESRAFHMIALLRFSTFISSKRYSYTESPDPTFNRNVDVQPHTFAWLHVSSIEGRSYHV